MFKDDVSLQINLAPTDVRHVVYTIPHQLRALRGQVGEIQFTLDTAQSRAQRYSTMESARKLHSLRTYLQLFCDRFPNVRIVDVDYSPESVRAVANAYMGGVDVPNKACDGSPFFAYLFGLFQARTRYVFHIDSDMLFGGGSQRWVGEAVALLEAHPDVVACTPLDGPPRSDGTLRSRGAVRNDLQNVSYHWQSISTRVCLVRRSHLLGAEGVVPLIRTGRLERFRAFLNHTAPVPPLEECLSHEMATRGLRRVDFLGSEPGMWHLHPIYRSERFYAELPRLIERVETDDIPEAQRGDYDVNDSMIDWSDVRLQKTLPLRFARQVRFAVANVAERMGSRGNA